MRIVIFLLNFYSISAVAGYHCTMKVSHVNRPEKVIAAKLISIEDGIRSGSEGEILKGLDVEAYLNGQSAEEEIEIVLNKKDMSSNKMVLKGNAQSVEWFDSYKIETSCQS